MKKYFLSFHTIFILNENIKWLEEFIIYYKHIGIEHFYLYDNEGSSGYSSSNTENRYGFKINTTSNEEDKLIFEKILNKYKNDITYIKWQPVVNNKIVYAQPECIKHFIKNYGMETEWCAFLDLDEFIFSKNNINIIELIKNLEPSISNIKIIQKKFLDRFLSNEKFITQEYKCINMPIGLEWAPKNICRISDFIDLENIHTMFFKGKTVIPHSDIIRFNHYNTNDKQLKFIVDFYKVKYEINDIDDGMSRYKFLFDKPI